MFCQNCGVQVPNDANVCPACGTRLFKVPSVNSASVDIPIAEKKPFTKRPIFFVFIALAAIIFLIVIISIASKPDPLIGTWDVDGYSVGENGTYYSLNNSIASFYDGGTYMFDTGHNVYKSAWEKKSKNNYTMELLFSGETYSGEVVIDANDPNSAVMNLYIGGTTFCYYLSK